MKRIIKRIIQISCLAVILGYVLFIIIYQVNCDAVYRTTNSYGEYNSIEYNGKLYVEGAVPEPYTLVHDEEICYSSTPKKYYVRQDLFFELFFPFRYFEFYCESFDDNEIFIINQPDRTASLYFPFIKEGFVYPTVDNNEVSEVWMSHLSNSENNIKDKEIVAKIVECAKSEAEIVLEDEIIDYIKKKSADNRFYLKYEGYPLVEEFHIEETEDGRYIIDQYTPEEYDTIYWGDQSGDGSMIEP